MLLVFCAADKLAGWNGWGYEEWVVCGVIACVYTYRVYCVLLVFACLRTDTCTVWSVWMLCTLCCIHFMQYVRQTKWTGKGVDGAGKWCSTSIIALPFCVRTSTYFCLREYMCILWYVIGGWTHVCLCYLERGRRVGRTQSQRALQTTSVRNGWRIYANPHRPHSRVTYAFAFCGSSCLHSGLESCAGVPWLLGFIYRSVKSR